MTWKMLSFNKKINNTELIKTNLVNNEIMTDTDFRTC